MPNNSSISQIELSGFKSIRQLSNFKLNDLNIFIGANGSGKTNFMSFFKMLQFYLNSPDGLNEYVGQNGGAEFLLHFGSRVTSTISARMTISTQSGTNEYMVELGASMGDKLYFKDEKVSYSAYGISGKNSPIHLGGGGKESRLLQIGKDDKEYSRVYKTIITIKNLMKGMFFYQFHDTGKNSHIRKSSHTDDNRYLRSDGGNLSSFLYMLRESHPAHYKNIVEIMRHIAPYIADIVLENEYNSNYTKLCWRENYSGDYLFDAGQMSDGTLRAFALVTLLCQPSPPAIICIDEPELGLHPEALSVFADLLKCASENSQIIISTQSPSLVDYFEPDDIVVVNRTRGETIFERLEFEKYKAWMDEYSISQIWDANIIGGRP
jgi:predicted ATPase